ncbi:MAG: redoxin domain-containing protein [Planctomycetes bacterium]|nr:redoxin domain-containing protein [Planctomycetota bacterium]
MRVISCMILLALLGTAGTGCSLFKKNTNPPAGPGGASPPRFPAFSDPLVPTPPTLPTATMNVPTGKSAASTRGNSILAGKVIDSNQRGMANAYVRWVSLEENDKSAPIDVAADAYGYFIIQGVKAGAAYKLIARAKQGDKLLAGTVLTNAPSNYVLIAIREDLANSDTPPIPGSPAQSISNNVPMNAQAPKAPGQNSIGVAIGKPVEPNLPATLNVPSPSTTPSATVAEPKFVPGVVENPLRDRLPMLNIPGKAPRPPLPRLPGDSKLDTGPTRVPSCVLIGNHLVSLALRDSQGQVWEYQKQGAGKLVLIDFWGTHCVYCRDSMPTFNRMHKQYGARGLEVIGIAIEKYGDDRKDPAAVNKMCASMQLSYRQLMGRSGPFDAFRVFNLQGLPTVVLLNEQGDIIYQHVGRPDAAELSTLERIIQSRLSR